MSKNKKKLRAIKATTKNKRIHNRAMVLLMIGKGKSQAEIAKLELLSPSGIKNILIRYSIGGVDFALFDRPRSGRPAIYSASDRQRIAAKACAEPPEGYVRWTVALLTDEVERDKQILSASRETVRTALHSHEIKPWLQKMWCVPKLTPEYVARMEDVLDLYERSYSETKPVICIDEKPIQLLDHSRKPVPMNLKNGIKKVDYEYKRNC